MRPRLISTIALAGVVTLAACGSSSKGTSSGSSSASECGGALAGIKKADGITFVPSKAGTLTVVTSLPGPGFWDGGDTIPKITGGYEFCLSKALGLVLGLQSWTARDEKFQAITTGVVKDFDVALTQSSITDERKQVVNFSDSYYKSDQSVIVKAGTKVPDLDALKKLKLGAQTGTTGEFFANEMIKPTATTQVFQDLTSAYTAVLAGQIDGVIMDTAINLNQVKASGGKLDVPAQFANDDNYGIILPKDSKNVAAVNTALKALTTDGVLTKLLASELGGDPSKVPFITIG